MKLLFISDIHGSLYYAKKAIEAYEKENADFIIILGDLLYHGAKNPLTANYSTMEVAQLLNKYSDKIIAVRGNCDSEVDQIVLNFPMMADYTIILCETKRIFLTHGHIYNELELPKLSDGDVFAFGHTHIPRAEKSGNVFIINPGSITLPKENNPNSYGLLENGVFSVKDFEGNVFKKIDLSK